MSIIRYFDGRIWLLIYLSAHPGFFTVTFTTYLFEFSAPSITDKRFLSKHITLKNFGWVFISALPFVTWQRGTGLDSNILYCRSCLGI